MRPSGVELVAAFTEGATAAGVDVVLLGLVSSDELLYATGALDSPGAMFTASHNPARYNGIKLCLAGAKPVGVESGLVEIRDAIEVGRPPHRERGPSGARSATATSWPTTPPRSAASSTGTLCCRCG